MGFDVTGATRLNLNAGDTIQVAPMDIGRNYPTIGKLFGLDKGEIVVQITTASGGILNARFL